MYGLPVVSQARRVTRGTRPVRSNTTIKHSVNRSLSASLCYVNERLLIGDRRPITDGRLSTSFAEKRKVRIIVRGRTIRQCRISVHAEGLVLSEGLSK